MSAYLDANADGLAFMAWVFLGMLAFLLVAIVFEWGMSASMRRRRRRLIAYRRYLSMVDPR